MSAWRARRDLASIESTRTGGIVANERLLDGLREGNRSFEALGAYSGTGFIVAGVDAVMWVPMSFPPGSVMDTRGNRFASVLGRLKPAVTLRQARDDLSAIAARLAQEEPQFNADRGIDLDAWQDGIVGPVRPTLVLMFGAVAFVRAAVGASAASLLRLVLVDGLRMALAAAAVGLLLAAALSSLMRSQLFEIEPVDISVYAGVTALLIVVAGVAAAVPAGRAARVDPVTALRSE